jgi:hypothetical protein
MKMRRFMLLAVAVLWFGFHGLNSAHAQATTSCPSGTYDMLDWMTLDNNIASGSHMTGNANPLYTEMMSNKFYWTKGGNGFPWDIQLYDNNNVYLWITEYDWNSPNTYKKSSYNTNMPFAPRCAKAGFPGAVLKIPNTSYDIYTDCTHYTRHTLKQAINEVWGPYYKSFGGVLPNNLKTIVVSYRYNCDSTYHNCGDKEEFWLAQKYGLVQWVHYALVSGKYQFKQKTVYNTLKAGGTKPYFQCF